MLNMMILASGSSLRIRRINSKPDTSGRLISMTVTSGRLETKARWPDLASVASSIFTELSVPNSDRHPDRITGWSSTINTLVASFAVSCIIQRFFLRRLFSGINWKETSREAELEWPMWKKLSLRTRLFLPLGLMFIAVLLAGGVALQILAPIHLMDEHRAGGAVHQSGGACAQRRAAHVRQPACDAGRLYPGAWHLRGHTLPPADMSPSVHPPIEVQTPPGRVPRWFVELIGASATGASFPVTIGEKRVGDIVFVPDLSADLFEKWIGFLAMACSAIAFLVLTGVIAYFSAGAAIRPLRNLGEGLTRMREGTTPTRSPRPDRWRSGGVARKPTNSPAPCTG